MIKNDESTSLIADIDNPTVDKSVVARDLHTIMDDLAEYNEFLMLNEGIKVNHTSLFLIALNSPESYEAAIDEGRKLSNDIFNYQWHIIAQRPHYTELYFLIYKLDTSEMVSMSKKGDLNKYFHQKLSESDFHEDLYCGEYWELEDLLTTIRDSRHPEAA